MTHTSDRIEDLLQAGVRDEVYPGAVWAVGDAHGIQASGAVGLLDPDRPDEPMRLDTVFDVASLTKILAVWSAIGTLVEAGKLQVHAPWAPSGTRSRVTLWPRPRPITCLPTPPGCPCVPTSRTSTAPTPRTSATESSTKHFTVGLAKPSRTRTEPPSSSATSPNTSQAIPWTNSPPTASGTPWA